MEKKVTAENLNEVMDFGRVIEVKADGTVEFRNEFHSEMFDVTSYLRDAETWDWETEISLPEGWSLMNGYSGQQGYRGPEMHTSEFIGGGMARDILETPGLYVALTVESDCGYKLDTCDPEVGCDCQPDGWVVATKPAE